MANWDWLFGKSGEIKALPTMSGEQSQLYSQLTNMLSGNMGNIFNQLTDMLSGSDEAFKDKATSQFQQEIVPQIAERFSGLGAGAQGSSAFGQQLGSAGANLAESLALHQQGIKQQGLGSLLQLLQGAISTPTFQYQQIPGTEGFLNPLLKGLGSGIGQFGGMASAGWLFNKLFK